MKGKEFKDYNMTWFTKAYSEYTGRNPSQVRLLDVTENS
jgi:hypothetical protein